MNPMRSAWRTGLFATILLGVLLGWTPARAVPAFARQTGQNCVACHLGGQFPELTAYGRQFKLTGYTMGTNHLPLSVMAVLGYSKTSNPAAGGADPGGGPFYGEDNRATLQGGSLFIAGRIANNLGMMGQLTYNAYSDSANGSYVGHSSIDNTEFRYADRFISGDNDLIVGAFVNNNPTMEDVWNSTPAWGYPYVVSSFAVTPPAAPVLAGGFAQQAAGLGGYADWNQTLYGEFALYGSARSTWSFLRAGDLTTRFSKPAPYWRLTWSHNWGPSNLMVGTNGMIANLYNDPTTTASSTNKFRDIGVDAQYQYILDPHAVSVHLSYIREKQYWGPDAVSGGNNPTDTLKRFLLKGAYTYNATYGGSLAYVRGSGTPDLGEYGASGDPLAASANGSPNYTVWIPELYWIPVQYVRVGMQYWRYTQFNGAGSNYTGMGRSAGDNNTVFLYVWAAY